MFLEVKVEEVKNGILALLDSGALTVLSIKKELQNQNILSQIKKLFV